jgi:hypothetical protein
MPVVLALHVVDAEAVFAQAVAAGATVRQPLRQMFRGDLHRQLDDPVRASLEFRPAPARRSTGRGCRRGRAGVSLEMRYSHRQTSTMRRRTVAATCSDLRSYAAGSSEPAPLGTFGT